MKARNVIYKITNLINNKCYIGKAKDFERRLHHHKHSVGKIKSPLYSAIQSYGWECFKIEIVETADDYSKLNELEIKHIQQHNSLYPAGYNLTAGGTGGDVVTNNPNKSTIYDNRKGRVPWNKGKKGAQVAWNKGTKGVVKANSTTFRAGKDHALYGKKQSADTVAKRLASTDYSKIKRHTVKVFQYDEYGTFIKEWESIKEASTAFSINKGMLRWYLDKPKLLKGYIWKRGEQKQ
jgi:group I intron endonuclease